MQELSVISHNDAADSGNPMHDDKAARAMGYKAALVPGVTVYGYMARLFVNHFGEQWLVSGFSHVRFRQPVFAGERLRLIAHEPLPGDPGKLALEVRDSDNSQTTVGHGSMLGEVMDAHAPCGPLGSKPYPEQQPLGVEKRPATRQSFESQNTLGSIYVSFPADEREMFCAAMQDPHPIYNQAIHPAWLLRQANIIVDRNFALGAWIHTESEVRNFTLARYDEEIEVRADVLALFERKGNQYADLDVLLLANGDPNRPIMRVMHRAIYLIAKSADS